MKNIILFCVASIFFCKQAVGQGMHFEVGMYGNASLLQDLRDLQKGANSVLDGSKMVTAFEPFVAFDLAIRFKAKDNTWVGPWFMYQSSGARNLFEDVTGYLKTDFILEGLSGGISVTENLHNERLFLTGNMGVVYNHLFIEQELNVFAESEAYDGQYWSLNTVFLFGIQYYLKQTRPTVSLVGQIDGSYFGINLQQRSQSFDSLGDIGKVKVDWTGIKLGLRLGL